MKISLFYKNHKNQIWILAAIVVFLLAWFKPWENGFVANSTRSYPESFGGVAMPAMDSYKSMDMDYSRVASNVAPDVASQSTDNKVIKTGSLSLHVGDVRETVTELKTVVADMAGYVDNSNINLYDGAYSGTVTLRVPDESFDAALSALKGLSIYVISEYTNSEDVTLYYTDLESRLRNYKAEEEQYLALLNRAESVDSIIAITQALTNIRYQIENLESQIKGYDNQINYSSITVNLEEDASPSGVVETWSPISSIKEAFKDWIVFLQHLGDKAIYLLVYGWPLVLAFGVYKIARKRK